MTSKNSRSSLFVLLAASAVSSALVAQEFQDPWRWTTYQTGSGLTSTRVFDVVETKDGTSWALTQEGIAWSEGFEWHSLGPPEGMPISRAWTIAVVSDSQIVAQFKPYIYLVGRTGGRRITPTSGGDPIGVAGFALRPNGVALIADTSGDLWESDAPFTRVRRSSIRAPRSRWRQLYMSGVGRVWGSADDGLYELEDETFVRRFPQPTKAAPSIVVRQNASGEGILLVEQPREIQGAWSITADGNLQPLDIENVGNIEAVAILEDGRRIISYGHGDVHIESDGRLRSLSSVPSTMRNMIFMRARLNGDLWVGNESGLSLFRGKWSLWDYWRYPAKDLRNQVSEIIKTRDGSIWVASTPSVRVYHPDGHVTTLATAAGISLQAITALAEDSTGNIWLGSGSGFFGALRWNGKRWQRFADPEGLGAHGIHRIWKDHSGSLWFLGIAPYQVDKRQFESEPGAFLYKNGTFKRWGVEEGLINGRVYQMTESRDGSLWFATAGGISRWKKGQWKHWRMENGLKTDRVFALASDTVGQIWFGDQNNGLGLIDTLDRVRYFTMRDGLLNDAVWGVYVDAENRVWCSTVSGLSCYLDGVWSKFDASTGLTSVRLWPILLTPERIYVGTRGSGVAILNRTVANSSSPRSVISRPIVENNSIFVQWKAYSYFGEIPFRDIECRTRLDDGPWSEWTTSRERVFVDVPAGEHRIAIQTKNLVGAIGPESQETVHIAAPWYKSVPFLVGLLLLIAVMLLQRSVNIRKRKAEERKIQENERRYRGLFEDSPMAIWEEDHADVFRAFDELRAQGVSNIRTHLEGNIGECARIARMIRIVDMNRAALALYHAPSKEALMQMLQQVRLGSPGPYICELLCRLAEGSTHAEFEVAETTMAGVPMYASVRVSALPSGNHPRSRLIVIVVDVTERMRLEQERENLIANLEEALANMKTLRGLIPICSTCKKIRDDKGYWSFLEQYLSDHSEAVVSHGLCPDCAKKMYPEVFGE